MAKPETALKDIFIEEAPELLGELSFLFFMLMVWEGLKYGARSDSRDHPAKPAGITT